MGLGDGSERGEEEEEEEEESLFRADAGVGAVLGDRKISFCLLVK